MNGHRRPLFKFIFFSSNCKTFLENQALFANNVTARGHIDSVENMIQIGVLVYKTTKILSRYFTVTLF